MSRHVKARTIVVYDLVTDFPVSSEVDRTYSIEMSAYRVLACEMWNRQLLYRKRPIPDNVFDITQRLARFLKFVDNKVSAEEAEELEQQRLKKQVDAIWRYQNMIDDRDQEILYGDEKA